MVGDHWNKFESMVYLKYFIFLSAVNGTIIEIFLITRIRFSHVFSFIPGITAPSLGLNTVESEYFLLSLNNPLLLSLSCLHLRPLLLSSWLLPLINSK